MGSGTGPTSTVEVGSAAVFRIGEPAHVSMSEDCAILSINVPLQNVESELEHLLGQAWSSRWRSASTSTSPVVSEAPGSPCCASSSRSSAGRRP